MKKLLTGAKRESELYSKDLPAKCTQKITLNVGKSFNWYDVSVKENGYKEYEDRFAGKIETGVEGKTDPLMGGEV